MSIQWTFIAGYLYFEVAVVMLMILPIFSPRRWHLFFKSRLFAMFREHAGIYFYGLLGILCLFLVDAIREMRKYSHTDASYTHFASEMKGSVKLFRAQRNFYITGFAIFLSFVIRRLVNMLIIQDELSLKAQRIIKEAEAAVKLAKTTVLANTTANTIRAAGENYHEETKKQLEITKSLLAEEKSRVKELEEEATKWRLKYEEVSEGLSGKGDE
ncbi:B-cell receptor-associated protein 31-like [Ostrinia nubilalis]|uniref:B-cell receptor-associated protein 31-like n=1 Tax=Ostrinia furnacalis TaxID=93504 RepID=UPI00103EA0C2|nr:B-cell receptor-associated protein 31-like [Ostrinia furnacalis]